jgi:hypothetical protein
MINKIKSRSIIDIEDIIPEQIADVFNQEKNFNRYVSQIEQKRKKFTQYNMIQAFKGPDLVNHCYEMMKSRRHKPIYENILNMLRTDNSNIFTEQIQKAKAVPLSEIFSNHGLIETKKWYVCPFHDDTKPSMTIQRSKAGYEYFKCYVCQEWGSGIDFIMKNNCVSFKEAVRILS